MPKVIHFFYILRHEHLLQSLLLVHCYVLNCLTVCLAQCFFKFKHIFLFCVTRIFNWRNQNISILNSSPDERNANLILMRIIIIVTNILDREYLIATQWLKSPDEDDNTFVDYLFIISTFRLISTLPRFPAGCKLSFSTCSALIESTVYCFRPRHQIAAALHRVC